MALYLDLKDHILKRILNGDISGGELLPTERQLSEDHQLSRVTVRKALEELKAEGLITSIQGQGTTVARRKGGFHSSLDLIALLAEVHNPFFASFMQHFEHIAEQNGSLVLFKQDFIGTAFEANEIFYRFIKKDIRNVVMWPHTDRVDKNLLARLRSIGMNLVFFDQDFETDTADIVSVDHRHAVRSLYEHMRLRHSGKIVYIGYHGIDLPSERIRQQTFREICHGEDVIYTVARNKDTESEVFRLLDKLEENDVLSAGILGCNGPIGLAVAKYFQAKGIEGGPLAAIDYLPEMANYPITAYQQPIQQLAEKAYQRLVAQNNQESLWQAKVYELQGVIVEPRSQ